MCSGCMTNVDAIGLSAIGVWAFGASAKRKIVARITGTTVAPAHEPVASDEVAAMATARSDVSV